MLQKLNAAASLLQDEVHLWHTTVSLSHAILQEPFLGTLSPAEKTRAQQFIFSKDRINYLVTRWMVRAVLSQYLAIPPSDWQFSATETGRPIVSHPSDGQQLIFNISHAGGRIVVAISRNVELGVDIERIDQSGFDVEMGRAYLSASELTAVMDLQEERRGTRAMEHWTLKEAYLKARSLGLSIPLQSFGFDLSDENIAFSAPSCDPDSSRWEFQRIMLFPGFIIALAYRESSELCSIKMRSRRIFHWPKEAVLDELSP